jgi:NADPH:quinone reductase-like Zn-dependent oxidoreductase
MKALHIQHDGPAGKLQLVDVALPLSLPLTLGWECAGTVDKVGARVSHFKPGDQVYTMAAFQRGGTYAEYVAVDAAEVALMPSTLSFMVAAGLPMTAQAAWAAIETAGLQSGQSVLIHGGAGGVGSLAIQLARARGARVCTTAATKDVARVRALGAYEVIDDTQANFADQLRGLDAVIDTLGGATQEASWATLKPGGILVALTQPPAPGRAEAAGARGLVILTQPRGAVLKGIAALIFCALADSSCALETPVKVDTPSRAGMRV